MSQEFATASLDMTVLLAFLSRLFPCEPVWPTGKTLRW